MVDVHHNFVQRWNEASERYTAVVDGRSTPGEMPFDIASGERSNFDQHRAAIGAGRSSAARPMEA